MMVPPATRRAPLRFDDQPRAVAGGPRGWILGRRAVSCDGAPGSWRAVSAALRGLRVELSAQLVASRGGMHAVGAEQRRPRGGLLRPRHDPKPAVRTCEPPKEAVGGVVADAIDGRPGDRSPHD